MIEAKNLKKIYDGVTVLDLPELSIAEGECFGLVGNNGAGKTTFFRLILDLIQADDGLVSSNGVNVKQSEHWKSYTGSYLDEHFLIDFLTPEEYFEFLGSLHGFSKEKSYVALGVFKEFFNGEIIGKNKYIRELSKGNQKKVGIAAALAANPDVLVLDEPFPHLDPTSVIRLKNLLKKLHAEREMTMLISSHDLNHVTEVCDRIAILEKGCIIRDIETGENTLRDLEAHFAVDANEMS